MAVDMPSYIVHEKFAKLKLSSFVSQDSLDTPSTPQTPDTPLLPPPEPYHLRVIQKEETSKVLDFLRQFFFRDEPLNVCLDLLEGQRKCPDLDKFSMAALEDNVSMMAVTDTGKIIGVSVNGIITKDMHIDDTKITDEKFRKIVRLLKLVDESVDIFSRYPDVDKVMMVEILSVDGSWRGQGIAKKLMNKTRDLAREQGFKLMRADCTSHFSAKAIARLGFECIYTLKYEDYKVESLPVFDPEPPHKQVAVYIQKIN